MNIQGRNKLIKIDNDKKITALLIAERINKLDFKKDQKIKLNINDKKKIAQIVEIKNEYIVVNFGNYRECFLKKDLARENNWRLL